MMTVAELITELSKLPPDEAVMVESLDSYVAIKSAELLEEILSNGETNTFGVLLRPERPLRDAR